jgi:hypothetical protein
MLPSPITAVQCTGLVSVPLGINGLSVPGDDKFELGHC